MYSLPVRIVIVVLISAYGIYKLSHGEQLGYLFLGGAALFVVGYFRYGSIRPAFWAIQRGQIEVAQKHIETIKFPKLLSAQSRAYFHWIRGVIAMQDPEKLHDAEQEMYMAIGGSLRTSNDRCLATATLARIVALNQDLERAKQILTDAEKIPHRETVTDYLNRLRTEFEDEK